MEEINLCNITLFTTALCNLNCGYCYICKDATGCLKDIDADLAQDFKENNQIKAVYDVDPKADEHINHITLWGGEPFLHMERFIDHIDDYFKAFPKIDKIDMSTNFTIPNQVQVLKQLIDGINRNYNGREKFFLDFQISIDGYEEMNDFGRGKGVTKKFLKNFEDLCNLEFDNSKIYLEVHTKPTLSKSTFQFLNTYEKALKWLTFFDTEMYSKYKNRKTNFNFCACLFNCATPSEWTKEDGIEYAKVLKSLQEASEDALKMDCWKKYPSIVPGAETIIFRNKDRCCLSQKDYLECSAPVCGGGCGSFSHTIVPLHNHKYTMCHRGIFDAYVDYHNNMKEHQNMNGLANKYVQANNESAWLYDKDEFLNLKKTMDNMILYQHQIFYTDYAKFVYEYAKSGIIDEKWTNLKEINKTLNVFLNKSCCLQDAYIITGSWITVNHLEIPLWYNGAIDIVMEEVNKFFDKRGVI